MDLKKYIYNALIDEYGVSPEKLYNRYFSGSLDVNTKLDWDVYNEMPDNSFKLSHANKKYNHYYELGLDTEAEKWHNEVTRLEEKLN